jgi:D-amino-acid dehydrogenase
MRVIVIGGGVVGAASALALAERGLAVTLIEARETVAEATSHANGGGVTPLHSEPWNGPALAGSLLRYIHRRDAPWRLPPRMLPALGVWGLKFLSQSRRTAFMANARANIRLGLHSLDVLRQWRERYALDYAQTTRGSLQLFHDNAALDRALATRRELIDGLGEVQRLDVDAVVEREPALAPAADRLAGALYYPDHESGDAARFAEGVAGEAQRQGAKLRLGETVRQLVCREGRFEAVDTEHERLNADACVVAAGEQTPRLLAPLGLRVPIQPVRGYSATFEIEGAELLPDYPLLDVAHRFVTLRLGERCLRVAGLADFAGHDRDIPAERVELMLAGARRLLPKHADALCAQRARLWAGLRPMTPDGRALLGETRIAGVYLNAGHGPMGWTQACGCADVLADQLSGRAPVIDPSPFEPGR